jgi:hypothetical protein
MKDTKKVIISYNNAIESTQEKIKQGVPQGSVLGPIFFLIYINDIPKLAPTGTKILLYADDTGIIVTSPNLENYEKETNKIFRDINYWFKLNHLVLNYNKTHYLQFNTKNSREYVLKLMYCGNYVKSLPHIKFLGLIISDSLSWKAHIDQMMSKLNMACFVIQTSQTIMTTETLRMIYFAYVHSVMIYRIIFWGNQPYSEKIFQNSKKGDQNYHKFKNERLM